MNKPQTIQIFLPDGSPTSLKEAELTNRLIKTLYFPRTAIDNAAKRKITKYTGVYFLFGEDEDGKPLVYIGEGENCWERIKDHHRKKDFWTDCIIAVTKTDEYTKTDAKFLEHFCLKKAFNTSQIEPDPKSAEINLRRTLDFFFSNYIPSLSLNDQASIGRFISLNHDSNLSRNGVRDMPSRVQFLWFSEFRIKRTLFRTSIASFLLMYLFA
jgi:hypothetical protein